VFLHLTSRSACVSCRLVAAGAKGYDPSTATGVDAAVIEAHIRQGEGKGGMLDCIFRVLLAVSTQQRQDLVIFCSHGKHRNTQTTTRHSA
jgi:hypothetical protein